MSNNPLIGILSKDNNTKIGKMFNNVRMDEGIVNSSYVKWLKSAGADVYIIPLFTTNQELTWLMKNCLSGIQFPGSGDVKYKPEFGRLMYHALNEVKNGNVDIPIFGTCMGHQVIAKVFVGDPKCVGSVPGTNPAVLPLDLVEFPKEMKIPIGGRMLGNFLPDLSDSEKIKLLAENNTTLHLHFKGFSPNCLTTESGLISPCNSVSPTSGFIFSSTVEHRTLPIYGVQFHPEKVQPGNVVDASNLALDLGKHIAEYFVGECRKYVKGKSRNIGVFKEKCVTENMKTVIGKFTEEHIEAGTGNKFMAYSMVSGTEVKDNGWIVNLYTV